MHALLNKVKGKDINVLPLTESNGLNNQLWTVAGVPVGDNQFWIYQDPSSRISYYDNLMSIEIEKFSLCHDQVQVFDNPKHLFLTREGYAPGDYGVCLFGCMMQAYDFSGNPDDYRDGFGAFNVLDFRTGMVFDIISNGHKTWIIYERLLMPGLVSKEDAFTKVTPINRTTHPGEILHCAVLYNRNEDMAEYYINYDLVYKVENIPLKVDSLQTGFGIITLHDIEGGKSRSCRGQGGSGLWGAFRVISY